MKVVLRLSKRIIIFMIKIMSDTAALTKLTPTWSIEYNISISPEPGTMSSRQLANLRIITPRKLSLLEISQFLQLSVRGPDANHVCYLLRCWFNI